MYVSYSKLHAILDKMVIFHIQ